MTSRISHTSIDCRNAYELSEWWRQLLDYVDVADDPNEPGHEECMILARDGSHHVLFIEVPEAKTVKNRLHFDLRPTDRTQQEEVDRLVGVGATVLADRRGQYGPGTGWVTMADPEGNEFCVLRGDGELAATPG
ncbi:MAG TPA: VOC family protein [Actinotalea caeni]|uniref:VOC family protein n=1 Tax=Actinotalea caeni TaxID=1348467 RepID=UPI002B4B8FDE|nr:VOC family protein [Actinotalea caeni]HLV54053.1 VOC family protein [Actinotalea caeni]